MRAGIVGLGNIGLELYSRLRSLGWDVPFILRSGGTYSSPQKRIGPIEDHLNHEIDVAFIAIPTKDDGRIAYDYITSFLDRGVRVITCEKGALSNYFPELEPRIHMIGHRATVGGGSLILDLVKEAKGITEIHAVVNGTMNYILSEVANGVAPDAAVKAAQDNGYAEPGASGILEVMNTESVLDVAMKSSILFNLADLTPERIKAKDIHAQAITEDDLQRIIAEDRRYIVSISKAAQIPGIGGFNYEIDGWFISGGFRRHNPYYLRLDPSGVTNSIVIVGDTIYERSGPGAGPEPTVSAMMKDVPPKH